SHLATSRLLCQHFYAHPSCLSHFYPLTPPPPRSTLFPYTTLFRSLTALACTSFVAKTGTGGSPASPSSSTSTRRRGSRGCRRCRSEEHTSELQSLAYLVCRLLLEKKNNKQRPHRSSIAYVSV